MAAKQTITINGKHYDTQTGLPVEAPDADSSQTRHGSEVRSTHIHAAPQKSHTLNRTIVQKNIPVTSAPVQRPAGPRHMDIARSSSISRFASHPVVKPAAPSDMVTQVAHPMVQKAHQSVAHKKHSSAPTHTPSQVLKNEAIAKAMSTPAKVHAKQSVKRRFPRAFSVASGSLAVLLLAGYLTYLNMPTISIRVAAVQSGINASYPDYRPSGYRLDGPIAYNDGEVSMRFAANAGPQSFTITEKRSSWNSSAVLENHVKKVAASTEYDVRAVSGLTIYTYDNDAAWVNGGILYTIEGDAPLSPDQVLRIATSL